MIIIMIVVVIMRIAFLSWVFRIPVLLTTVSRELIIALTITIRIDVLVDDYWLSGITNNLITFNFSKSSINYRN
jgi:hypothetical protein